MLCISCVFPLPLYACSFILSRFEYAFALYLSLLPDALFFLYLLWCVQLGLYCGYILTFKILITDELVDRNCECCVTCCIDYEGWLQFQNGLYGIVKDPLFELFITTCIVLNTLFLALEHHGMSENVRQALDIGNKVRIVKIIRSTFNIFNIEVCYLYPGI